MREFKWPGRGPGHLWRGGVEPAQPRRLRLCRAIAVADRQRWAGGCDAAAGGLSPPRGQERSRARSTYLEKLPSTPRSSMTCSKPPPTIDRVLRNVVASKRPGYLEIPRDRVYSTQVPAPTGPIAPDPFAPGGPRGRPGRGHHRDPSDAREGAIRPALYVGVGCPSPRVDRRRLSPWPSSFACPWRPTCSARRRSPRATPSSPAFTWAPWAISGLGRCLMGRTA